MIVLNFFAFGNKTQTVTVTQMLSMKHPQPLGDHFRWLAQVAWWKANYFQTVVVRLRLSAVALRQVVKGFQITAI